MKHASRRELAWVIFDVGQLIHFVGRITLTLAIVATFFVGISTRASLSGGEIVAFEKADEMPDAAYSMIKGARIVWLGEAHGTKESPKLFLGLVRLIARNDRPPIVALEIPSREQPVIDSFIKEGDPELLKTGTFFGRKMESQDGRTSQAMAELLFALRSEQVERVVCFDPPLFSDDETPKEENLESVRADGMARRIAQCAFEHSKAKVVVLSGGLHSSMELGIPGDPKYQPAGLRLSKMVGPVLNFEMRYGRGTAWTMQEDGARTRVVDREWTSNGNSSSPYYIVLEVSLVRGHRGGIFTKTVTASMPYR